MCVTNIYIDRYPDGKEIEFRQSSICQNGSPGRPCPKHSTLENPPREIKFGEPTTELLLTHLSMPPSSSGWLTQPSSTDSGYGTSEKSQPRGKMRSRRQHRETRIIIVDEPPRPRSPPMILPRSTSPPRPFERGRVPGPIPWAPSVTRRSSPPPRSPLTPPAEENFRNLQSAQDTEAIGCRSRSSDPQSVDHQPELQRKRVVLPPRNSPSPAHVAFDSRARRELEERERDSKRHYEREERHAELEAETRRAQRIAAQNLAIRQRPAAPPAPLGRAYLRPVVDQSEFLQDMMGELATDGRGAAVDAAAEKMRREDVRTRQRLETLEEEAMKQRLRERQVPMRRFSAEPGHRRQRVIYDDGVYRWDGGGGRRDAYNAPKENVKYKPTAEDFDGESEISADAESVLSTSYSVSSKSSRSDRGVSEEFVALLLAEDSLKTLFQKSSQVLDGNTFKQKFKWLLTKFSRDLHLEAKKPTEILAARLVRLSRRRVTYAIWKEIYGIESGQSISGALDNSRLNKAIKMEETLKRLNMTVGQDQEAQLDQRLFDVDSSEDGEEVYKKLPNLQQVKRFLVNGQGFWRLQNRFEGTILESQNQRQVATAKAQMKISSEDAVQEDAALLVAPEFPLSIADQTKPPMLEPPTSLTTLSLVEPRGRPESINKHVSDQIDVDNSFTAESALEELGSGSDLSPGAVLPTFEVVTDGDPNLVEASVIVCPQTLIGPDQENSLGLSKIFTDVCQTAWFSWGNARNHVDRLFRPSVQPGYRRLEWRAECGTWLYGDYDNNDPLQVDEFYHELTKDQPIAPRDSDAALQTKDGSDQSTTVPSGPPASSSTSSTATSQVTSSTTPATSIDSAAPNGTNSTNQLSIFNNQPVPPLIRKYFAICVNTGENLAILGEIEVSTLDHDGEYFKKMWDEYDKLRGFRSKYFRRLLIKPADVKYVQFTVEEHQRADISFEPPIIPPPSEVTARNYEYTPCPLTTRPSAQTFLHYRDCTSCVKSREKKKKLFRRLPKKLSRGLLDVYLHAPPDEDVLGWGVLIIEGPNKLVITMLGAVMLTLSVIVAVIYTSISKDASSGFTIGSFLVAIWVSWMTAFYYYCKET